MLTTDLGEQMGQCKEITLFSSHSVSRLVLWCLVRVSASCPPSLRMCDRACLRYSEIGEKCPPLRIDKDIRLSHHISSHAYFCLSSTHTLEVGMDDT